MSRQRTSSAAFAALLALTAASAPLVASSDRPAIAQSSNTSPASPSAVPSGTTVQINGTNSMTKLNQALAERFKARFPGTDVKIADDGTDAALKDLLDGKVDIAAIGRSLTNEEKAKGLATTPVTRHKIALIVGPNNPFKGSLTIGQFAKIFRGEITNWSQVGGASGNIWLVDRPETSDTRRAFQNYPVFQNAPFVSSGDAVRLVEDSTEAVIKELGSDGIGYAIADQVVNNPNVRIISMHKVPPTDARYPFSQPLLYAYKGPTPSPGVQAFLGYVTAPENKQVIEEARTADAIAAASGAATSPDSADASKTAASPEATATASPAFPEATATASPGAMAESPGTGAGTAADQSGAGAAMSESERGGLPWWIWLLPLALLAGLLWWFLKGRESQAGAAVVPVAAAARTRESRIVLTPRNCWDAYAYWEVPDSVKEDLQRQGGHRLKLRLYDVTDIDMERQTPHSVKEFDCHEREQDLHVPIAVDDRDYIAELGYLTEDGRWLQVARSTHVRVPACEPAGNGISTAAAVAGAAGLAGVAGLAGAAAGAATPAVAIGVRAPVQDESRLILVPRNSDDTYAYWEVAEEHKADLRQQGGQNLTLRVHDTTGIDLDQQPAHIVWEYACEEQPDLHIPTPEGDRDYIAELGYTTEDGRWLKLARSAPVRVSTAELTKTTSKAVPNATETTGSAASNLAWDTPETASGDAVSTAITSEQTSSTVEAPSNIAGTASGAFGAAVAAGAAAIAGLGTAARSRLDHGQSHPVSDRLAKSGSQPTVKDVCRIILVPRNSKDAYAYWEVSDNYKSSLRQQGGRKLMLKVHDATNLDIDDQPPHNTQDYPCEEHEQDKHVSIPVSDRDYIAELGYYTDDNRWLRIIRSFHVHVPAESTSL